MENKSHNPYQTMAERDLAALLRAKKIVFEHNINIYGYEVDFWFPQNRLVVELDGYTHLSQKKKQNDQVKDKILNENYITVIRFNHQQLRENINQCVTEIVAYLNTKNTSRKRESKGINDQWKESLKQIETKEIQMPYPGGKSIEAYFLAQSQSDGTQKEIHKKRPQK